MEAFVWDQNFITGVEMVDSQHQTLIGLFDELANAFLESDSHSSADVQEVFERLVAFSRFHFEEEQTLMRAENVFERHRQLHEGLHHQFLDQVELLWQARASLRDPAEQLVGFLTSWLGLHILGTDQDMTRQIQRIREGMSPKDAFDAESEQHDNSTRALLKMVGRLFRVLSEQNAQLAQANVHLEERVQLRTRELENANDALLRANRQLEVYARTDGLLQIANRKYFDERLIEECSRAFRSQLPLGVLMIDVDYFKRFNDRYGHLAGDSCLQSVASACSSALLRAGDLLARYGGEELVVLLPDTTAEGAQTTAQRVLEAVRQLKIEHAGSDAAAIVTVSIGVVCSVPAARDAGAALLALADAALYHAKESGRNQIAMSATPLRPEKETRT